MGYTGKLAALLEFFSALQMAHNGAITADMLSHGGSHGKASKARQVSPDHA